MRSALFLLAAAAAVCALGDVLPVALAAWPGVLLIWIQALLGLIAFGVTSFLGLKVLDGDQTKMLRRRSLSVAHILFLALLGALAVCPVSLMTDVVRGLLQPLFPFTPAAGEPLEMAQFLPMLVQSVIIAPVCEELFFRGYLFGVMEREGEETAIMATSAIFTAVHGFSAAIPAHLLLGILLSRLMLRTGSVLAPMLVHASFNLTILVTAFMGLDGLLSGLSLLSGTVCLLGSAAFFWVLKRTYTVRAAQTDIRLELPDFSKRECAVLIGAAVSVIIAGVLI